MNDQIRIPIKIIGMGAVKHTVAPFPDPYMGQDSNPDQY